MPYRQVNTISCDARSLFIDRQDRLHAASGAGIHIWDAAGQPIRHWSSAKPVTAVAVFSDGQVFAGEEGQVEIFDSAGKLLRTWRDGERMGEITALRFVPGGVVIADARDRCLRRYNGRLEFVNNIGKENRTRGFLIPNGRLDFDLDAQGAILACNPGKHRVERYSLDGELLGHIGRFDGLDPEGFPGCCNPTNVASGKQGRVFVTEKAAARAKVLSAEGKLVSVISTDFDASAKNMDIALDSRGRVYVADSARQRITVFEEAS